MEIIDNTKFYLDNTLIKTKKLSIILLAIIVLAFMGCKGNEEGKIPDNVLLPEKMTNVLVDVQLLEASIGLNLVQPNDSLRKDSNTFYSIFENNSVTKKQYDESMIFYTQHPELLNAIYDSVLVKLDALKDTTLN